MQEAWASVSECEYIARRRPGLIYFLLAFGISWAGALVVAAPALVREHQPSNVMGVMMFPVMLLGPIISGIVLTVMVDGRAGLQDLFRRITAVRVAVRWYAMLLVPPALVLGLLLVFEKFISPVFAPNHFYLGMAFGVPAGICEEIGWMGFLFPKMRASSAPCSPPLFSDFFGDFGICPQSTSSVHLSLMVGIGCDSFSPSQLP